VTGCSAPERILRCPELNQLTREMRALGGAHKFLESEDIADVSYSNLAARVGPHAIDVRHPDEITSAYSKALDADRPVLFDVYCDPDVSRSLPTRPLRRWRRAPRPCSPVTRMPPGFGDVPGDPYGSLAASEGVPHSIHGCRPEPRHRRPESGVGSVGVGMSRSDALGFVQLVAQFEEELLGDGVTQSWEDLLLFFLHVSPHLGHQRCEAPLNRRRF
jgi:hypothetical protein